MQIEKKEKHSNTRRACAEEQEFERNRSIKRKGNKRKMSGITGVKDEQKHKTEEHKKKRTKHKRNMGHNSGRARKQKQKTEIQEEPKTEEQECERN